MKFTQRAMLYILRKKGKTAGLFLLIFIVGVFLVSCFGVLSASERISGDIRKSVGAAFYIRANTEVSINENGETEVKENSVHITQKEIDEIMQTGGIKYCNPINYGFVKGDDIDFIPGDKHTEENNMGKVTALRFSALAADFTDETAVLTEGKHITESDEGKILISEQLANYNNISVGDVLTLTSAKPGERGGEYIDEIPVKTAYVKAEIKGIYRLNIQAVSVRPTAGVAENKIFASLDVLDGLHESEKDVYTGEVDFYITDPFKLKEITRNVQLLPSIDWTTHFIRTNDFQYSGIADRLSSLGGLMKILLVLVSAVSAVILTLLLTMRMRGRVREAGILLAAGISKGQITAGFLTEVLSVAIIAMILSYIASFGVASFLGHTILDGFQPNLLNDETLTAGAGGLEIENYFMLRPTEVLFIYLCQLTVTAASAFVPSVIIMRLKPKKILSIMS